jgi:hypothetical protein
LLTHPLFLLKAIFSNLSRTKIVQAGRIKPMPLKITAGRPLKITASRQAGRTKTVPHKNHAGGQAGRRAGGLVIYKKPILE